MSVDRRMVGFFRPMVRRLSWLVLFVSVVFLLGAFAGGSATPAQAASGSGVPGRSAAADLAPRQPGGQAQAPQAPTLCLGANPFTNPGFETSNFTGWTRGGDTQPV